MKKMKLGEHSVVMFDSIEELPIVRFQKYNKMLMLDAGLGSDLTALDAHLARVGEFIKTGETDNAARVRFIFIDYMIRRIKKGYFMKRCMTPAEIGAEIALEDDEKALFAVYDKARYAGQRGVEEITDAMVGELQLVNRKRNQ